MDSYHQKYLKYKVKYNELKKLAQKIQKGGYSCAKCNQNFTNKLNFETHKCNF
jgi:hypothetical protein